MKITRAFAGTILFLIIMGVIYYIHIVFLKINVVFYAAIADAVLATLITGLFIFSINYFCTLTNFEKSQLLLIWLLMGYSFAISVPTVIDRSLSFYMLEKIQQRGGGIKQNSFEEVFTKEYFKEARVVDVRITEQIESGTIIIKDDCVLLTEKGNLIASIGRSFKQNLLPKKRLVMGEYSDDLTDPFRDSLNDHSYICSKSLKKGIL